MNLQIFDTFFMKVAKKQILALSKRGSKSSTILK